MAPVGHSRVLARLDLKLRSTRIYGHPTELAAAVSVSAVHEFADRFDEIRFIFLDEGVRQLFQNALEERVS